MDMNCPFCGSTQVMVANSRMTKKDTQIWRRRKCLDCSESFTTYERIELSYLKVVKKSGIKEYYNRPKLYSGIYSAIASGKKVDRGDSGEAAEEILLKVEFEILKTKKKTVDTDLIKQMVVKQLFRFDWRAALRYWAYFASLERKYWKRLMRLGI